MNPKRIIIAIIAGFIFIFMSDFLIHGLWLKSDYAATASLWRTEAEMTSRMPWMFGGELLGVVTFVMIYAGGFADRSKGPACGAIFGFFMGLFTQAYTLIMYVVSPMPLSLSVKWFVSGLIQAVLLGVITFLVYKPLPSTAK